MSVAGGANDSPPPAGPTLFQPFIRCAALALGFATLALTLGGCIERTTAPPRGVEPIGPIYGEHLASQTFMPRDDAALVGIDVRLATYGRHLTGTVVFRVESTMTDDPPGTVSLSDPCLARHREVTVDASTIRDNAVYRVRFDPVGPHCHLAPPACALTFMVENVTSDAGNPLTVWATSSDVEPTGEAWYSGQPRDVDLVVAPVYLEPLPDELGAQIGRLLRDPGPPLVALLLLFAPGYLLASLFIGRAADVGLRLAAAPAFGLGAVALSILWATAVGIHLGSWFPWLLVGGSLLSIGLAGLRQPHAPPQPSPASGEGLGSVLYPSSGEGPKGDGPWFALALTGAGLVAGLVIRAIALGDGVVPLGADSYHHTVITQLVVERGVLPRSYEPYAPIASFSYHFGFHAMAALVALVTGKSALEAVSLLGPLLNGLPALSVFFLVRAAGLGSIAAAGAAVVVSVVSPFPLDLLAFGRFPQEAALVILPVAAAFVLGYPAWRTADARGAWVRIAGGGFLTAGLFLTHYRMAVLLAGLVAVCVTWEFCVWAWRKRKGWPQPPSHRLWAPVAMGVIGVACAGPWLGRLAQGFTLGIRDSGGRYGPEYYSVERLAEAVGHPGFAIMLVLGLLGCGLAVATRQRLVLLLAVWVGFQLLLSNPYWLPLPLAGYVDTPTVIASAFLPLAVATGWLLWRAYLTLEPRVGNWAQPLLALGVAAATLWGALQLPALVSPSERLVDDADIAAANWIRASAAPTARFLVNASVQQWQPDFVVPTDAGYWLPILAARSTTLLPMVYPAERGASAAEIDRMEQVALASAADPGAPATLQLLHDAGVTHLYIGARGGPIDERKVAESRAYRRVYQAGGVSIYELTGCEMGACL